MRDHSRRRESCKQASWWYVRLVVQAVRGDDRPAAEQDGTTAGALSRDTMLAQFTEESQAWVLKSGRSEQYLILPSLEEPDRCLVRFFLTEEDANQILSLALTKVPRLVLARLYVARVPLLESIRRIANGDCDHADSYTVHCSSEVRVLLEDMHAQTPRQ